MHFAHRLHLAAAAAVVILIPAAFAQTTQTTSIVPLKAPTARVTVEDVSIRTMGKIGSKEAESYKSYNLDGPMKRAAVPRDPPEIPEIPPPGFYPGDVTNPGDGPTVESWKAHPVYVNSSPGTWGDVPEFLKDLGHSKMVHVIDQYVGAFGNHRYELGTQYQATGYPVPTPGIPTATSQTLLIQDIANLVAAAATLGGNGYDHIYHIFIPPGVDMCLVSPTGAPQCYSPDNPNTWYFCAFHGAFDFQGYPGHVLFSVEPYQDVNGCSVPPNSPNGQLRDSTDNVLSHESFEAISDPDGTAWWVQTGTVLEGEEIGDNCIRSAQFPQFGNNYYWNYGVVRLEGHRYMIQPEYSNAVHGCAYGPLD